MFDHYSKLQSSVGNLRGAFSQAIIHDQQEIAMSLAAASSMGLFGVAGAAAASAAQSALQAAAAQGTASLSHIQAVTLWAEPSRDSSNRLRDRGHSWAYLNDEVLELRDLMVEVQGRGLNNEWTGEAKKQWQAFTDRQIAEHDRFEDAVVKVAPLMFEAGEVTDELLMGFVMAAEAVALPAKTIAARPPMPNPSGFGIGTRTPMVANLLSNTAARFSANQNGPWRPRTAAISAKIAASGNAMHASVAQGAL